MCILAKRALADLDRTTVPLCISTCPLAGTPPAGRAAAVNILTADMLVVLCAAVSDSKQPLVRAADCSGGNHSHNVG
jgi:hypothetical protein